MFNIHLAPSFSIYADLHAIIAILDHLCVCVVGFWGFVVFVPHRDYLFMGCHEGAYCVPRLEYIVYRIFNIGPTVMELLATNTCP